MTTLAVLDRPPTGLDDDDPTHVVCCDPDLALCGEVPVDGEWQPAESEVECPICALADEDDLPCGDPACPVGAL